ncbi:uncharacterized protein UHO2_03838 [Ustilago hordei]|uniref:uncharacterized protein n=1 Tax=Ustilago hordei TaxID=120017 RepID=UPI001A4B5E39|nr:uncharacterized protein UHO2_03838 [Ustilago hordei]SYW86337.1 uncharacterized protein UHO2_03838 [Ustilago hordei]
MATQFRSHDTLSACTLSYASKGTQSHVALLLAALISLSTFSTEAFQWNYSSSGVMSLNKVQEILSVALYRLGHSGNGGGECDAALQCGCGVGSIVGYTNHTVAGLLELNNEVMQFASEGERQHASAWVHNTTGVEEWGKGWLVIVESVVGQPGSVQDSKVWASGSNILKKPRLYLDEGEFIWVDGGYGHSAFTVGPFSHIAANKSRDLRHFNYMLSRVQVQVEHAIAYLKNRFQCLTGYHGNIYHFKDCITAAETIQACIVAHTFASQYDCPADIADLLLPSFSEDEGLFQALFRSTGHNEEDTTALSRHHERTTVDYIAMTQSTSARRQEQVLTQPFLI